jgi:hypothetical protein
MPRLKNRKDEIFARELAIGKTAEEAYVIALLFTGKLEPEEEFRKRLWESFNQRLHEFFSLFVEAKKQTFLTFLEHVKRDSNNIDQAVGMAILFAEECALSKAIIVLPAHCLTRAEFEALPIHRLFRDDLLYRGEGGIDTDGAPLGWYRAPLAGGWIVVNGMFYRPDIDAAPFLNWR